jgi:hypothetical protein
MMCMRHNRLRIYHTGGTRCVNPCAEG